jgi:hypothetical protein
MSYHGWQQETVVDQDHVDDEDGRGLGGIFPSVNFSCRHDEPLERCRCDDDPLDVRHDGFLGQRWRARAVANVLTTVLLSVVQCKLQSGQWLSKIHTRIWKRT